MAAKSVLVITHSQDAPAQLVIDAIKKRGAKPVRFDTDKVPFQSTLRLSQQTGAAPRFELEADGEVVDLSTIESVWYRRFYGAALPAEVEPRYVRYSKQETRTLLSALFAALTGARWIDPIERVHRAHHKVLQLELAKAAGLTVPDTLCTNDPNAARAFYEAHPRGIVTKMLNAISFNDDGSEQMVFTSSVTEQHLRELDGLRFCPAVFQEKVEKDVELRVAVVGERLFVGSIDTRKSNVGDVDWRRDQNLAHNFKKDSLPPAVEASVHKLMRAFELTYGSLDIIRRPDGEHVFLEINSAGEWAWLATQVGLPIHEAIADELTR